MAGSRLTAAIRKLCPRELVLAHMMSMVRFRKNSWHRSTQRKWHRSTRPRNARLSVSSSNQSSMYQARVRIMISSQNSRTLLICRVPESGTHICRKTHKAKFKGRFSHLRIAVPVPSREWVWRYLGQGSMKMLLVVLFRVLRKRICTRNLCLERRLVTGRQNKRKPTVCPKCQYRQSHHDSVHLPWTWLRNRL